MIITSASRDDLYEFVKIEKEVFGVDAFGIYILEQYFNNNLLFQKIIDPSNLKIVGFAIITERTGSETTDEIISEFIKKIDKSKKLKKKIAHLINFLIRKEYWNNKIGNRFLDQIIVEIKKKGYEIFMLEVSTINKIAIKLYKKHGFQIIEEIKEYYTSGEDAYIMMLY